MTPSFRRRLECLRCLVGVWAAVVEVFRRSLRRPQVVVSVEEHLDPRRRGPRLSMVRGRRSPQRQTTAAILGQRLLGLGEMAGKVVR
ncbi:hypothetical protein BC829DRAFT_379144 [Chytridium lagenaria]|nr:hypothetical protein BC829DRAFT_379144 [Chytridium lagenaria]